MVWSQKSHKWGGSEGCTAAASFIDQEHPFLNTFGFFSGLKVGLQAALLAYPPFLWPQVTLESADFSKELLPLRPQITPSSSTIHIHSSAFNSRAAFLS